MDDKLTKLRDQKVKSRITAPSDGLVVYCREDWDEEPKIKVGAQVVERQRMIELPDTSSMKASIRVPEAKIERLKLGLTATVQIEGFTGRRFTGKVSRIAVLADSRNWFNRNLKEYETEILLDGRFTDLKPGTYTLTLMMPDYQTWTEKVEVQAGIVNDLWPRLVPATPGQSPDTTGQVFAYSTPGGANVFLDNAFVGITPVTLRDIAEGSHTVTFRLPGYPDYSTTADVTGGQVVNVPAAFTRQAGSPAATAPRPTQAPVCGITALVGIAAALIYRSRNR